MLWFFFFFFVSGLCSTLYELIWLRTAMAQFGVNTALVSIVLSTFMAGLGAGSWISGRLVERYPTRLRFPVLRLYAATEFLIGISAVLVPSELLWGRTVLERFGLSSSLAYYAGSGVLIAFTLIPWCALMGATIPIGMLAIRRMFEEEAQRSFSYLYLSNVFGAMAGAILPLFIIEAFGFLATAKVGAALNFSLACAAFLLSIKARENIAEVKANELTAGQPSSASLQDTKLLVMLFLTGLTSMGMEVVWIRTFTPYLGTVVYAFSTVLALYLAATVLGSRLYRRSRKRGRQPGTAIYALLGLFAVLPVISADPRFTIVHVIRVVIGIVPFCAVVGFLTPMLVDRVSQGDPKKAGSAYAVNVAGCILGPLLSGFVLLPLLNERWVLFVLALPWMLIGIVPSAVQLREGEHAQARYGYAMCACIILLVFASRSYENLYGHAEVRRDHTATVVATGEGMDRRLLVNGVGITNLTPITKMMAHLPLALLDRPPANALVICFGMGTTYRSMLSWGIPTTAVELVPSVPKLFHYYHDDAERLLQSPLSHVVIDDGRRFLERSSEQYDVIAIDPPPPIEAAASSLLYSKEFYALARRRLRPDGILQQWLPSADRTTTASVVRALQDSFPYVRTFRSIEGWGLHFLASDGPIPSRSAEQLVLRMPPAAVADLMEWGPEANAVRQFDVVLGREVSTLQEIALAPNAPALRDDRPVNEYYLLRRARSIRWLAPTYWAYLSGIKPPAK